MAFTGALKDDGLYVLDFVQEPVDGRRIIVCRNDSHPQSNHTMYSTPAARGYDLTTWRKSGLLSEKLRFTDGSKFHLGAHGEWITHEEFVAWRRDLATRCQRL